MLWTLVVVFFILWILGLATVYTSAALTWLFFVLFIIFLVWAVCCRTEKAPDRAKDLTIYANTKHNFLAGCVASTR